MSTHVTPEILDGYVKVMRAVGRYADYRPVDLNELMVSVQWDLERWDDDTFTMTDEDAMDYVAETVCRIEDAKKLAS